MHNFSVRLRNGSNPSPTDINWYQSFTWKINLIILLVIYLSNYLSIFVLGLDRISGQHRISDKLPDSRISGIINQLDIRIVSISGTRPDIEKGRISVPSLLCIYLDDPCYPSVENPLVGVGKSSGTV